MTVRLQGPRLRQMPRDVWLLLATSALVGFTVWGGMYTVILNLYLLRLGYDFGYIGLINGLGAFTVAIFALLAGIAGERMGTRRLLIIGVICIVVGYFGFPLAGYASAGTRSALFLVTYFVGHIGMSFYIVNASPFLTALTQGETRALAFAWQTGLTALAAFAGSLIAGFLPGVFAALQGGSLADPAPYHVTLLLAGGLLSAAIVPLVATDHAEISTTSRAPQATGSAPLGIIITLALVSLLTIVGEGTARTFFNVYFDTRLAVPTARIGAVAALAQLLAAVTSIATPTLIQRIGTAKATLVGGLIKTLCILPLALIDHWIPAGLGLMGLMAFAGILRPAFTIYHQESVAPHWRAAVSGAITMATAMGFFIAAFVGGNLIPLIGYRGLFMIGAITSLAGMLVFWARFVVPARSAEAVGAELGS